MTLALDLLGLVGSFLISASLVPQILKVYRTRSARDISRSFQLLYVLGLLLVAIYGLGEALWPIYIPVLLELAGGLLLLAMKLHYERVESAQDLEAGQATAAAVPSPTSVAAYKYNMMLTPK
jgi:MtN3 and saliva related transmembrane protein